MKPEEVAVVLDYVRQMFPHAKYGDKAIIGFTDGLHDLDAAGVMEATKRAVKRSDWPPSVAAIRREYYALSGVMGASEAWDALIELVRRGNEADYRAVPEIAMQAVQAIGGLAALRMTEHPSLLRKDFIASYEATLTRELVEPKLTRATLGMSHDGRLAGTSTAIGATSAGTGVGQHGAEPSRPEGFTGIGGSRRAIPRRTGGAETHKTHAL